jgi:hypothetical protein
VISSEGGGVTYIEDLKDAIRRLYGVGSAHVGSVPVKETFKGKTVWEGVVEVFDIYGHPTATKAYAWAQDTEDSESPHRDITTVLHSHPVISAEAAVRAAIVQEFRNLGTAEEN